MVAMFFLLLWWKHNVGVVMKNGLNSLFYTPGINVPSMRAMENAGFPLFMIRGGHIGRKF